MFTFILIFVIDLKDDKVDIIKMVKCLDEIMFVILAFSESRRLVRAVSHVAGSLISEQSFPTMGVSAE